MYHREKSGASKLVPALTYPATARGCVKDVVTDLAYIDVDADGFVLRELAPGLGVDDVGGDRGAARGRARSAGDAVRLTVRRRPPRWSPSPCW